MTTPSFTPSPELLAGQNHYEREGYAIFPHVLDTDLMHEAQGHLSWLIQSHPDRRPEDLQSILLGTDPFWLRLVSDPRLLNIAEMFIGPNIALFGAHYFCKPPLDGKAVLWHQDGAYWPLEPMEVVTLWLAVDDVSAANGCLRLIPGSQHLSLQEMQAATGVENVLNSQIDPALVDESSAIACEMLAGGVEVHHPNIIHGSRANTSPKRRDGLAIRYIPTTTRITASCPLDATRPWESFVLRGKSVPGINEYAPRPRFEANEDFRFRGCEEWT